MSPKITKNKVGKDGLETWTVENTDGTKIIYTKYKLDQQINKLDFRIKKLENNLSNFKKTRKEFQDILATK